MTGNKEGQKEKRVRYWRAVEKIKERGFRSGGEEKEGAATSRGGET